MKPAKVLWLWAVLVPALAAGCSSWDARVVPLANQDAAALEADDVVRVMQRAGFSDQQILDLGTDLRNALASGGAAQIRVGKKVEALFATDGHYLYASSRRGGSFIYDLEKRTFR
jgi:hypothetical protein